ncbi:isoprenylcysteine carboxylmethyltransferase family protein [Jannaschia sp. LMIT008]|uniref:methyltransferase family protein n=1 Tax=Jannaschia maritima TaxID=3032585 RepID=UPI002810A214|nr:isoprenylcysteine carboxylmethyltransferase family protein [Jannaschia sp. LMIT008]
MSHLKGFPDLPPVWALGVWLLQKALAAWLPLWRFDARLLGFALVVLGLAVIGWAALWFFRKRTPIEPHHAPRALIVEGPYRLNRNPIYTALTVILLGTALNGGALSAVMVTALFPIVITRRFAIPEERALRAAFGAEADAYIAGTRRW